MLLKHKVPQKYTVANRMCTEFCTFVIERFLSQTKMQNSTYIRFGAYSAVSVAIFFLFIPFHRSFNENTRIHIGIQHRNGEPISCVWMCVCVCYTNALTIHIVFTEEEDNVYAMQSFIRKYFPLNSLSSSFYFVFNCVAVFLLLVYYYLVSVSNFKFINFFFFVFD